MNPKQASPVNTCNPSPIYLINYSAMILVLLPVLFFLSFCFLFVIQCIHLRDAFFSWYRYNFLPFRFDHSSVEQVSLQFYR